MNTRRKKLLCPHFRSFYDVWIWRYGWAIFCGFQNRIMAIKDFSEKDFARLKQELDRIEREKTKIRKRAEQSYSVWLIQSIGQWAKRTFLN
jgi:hypothetical protein